MNKKIGYAGFVLLIASIALTVFYQKYQKAAVEPLVLRGLVGGEKTDFLNDPDVKKILEEKGFRLDFSKRGSIEMVKDGNPQVDFLWPSNQVAVEIFRRHAPQDIRVETIFNSPIVIYSWDLVTDALIKQNIVEKKGESYFILDLKKLLNIVTEGKTSWASFGVPELYGNINVISTHPSLSNSGNIFAALLANIYTENATTRDHMANFMPRIEQYFKRLGNMERSSGDLFQQYIRTGVGSKPLVVGYENQMIEWAHENQSIWQSARTKVRILYPKPTVWSEHPLIALNGKAKPLIDALMAPEIRKIAWEKHGFRIGLETDVKKVPVEGLPETIEQAISMPSADIMEEIIQNLQKY